VHGSEEAHTDPQPLVLAAGATSDRIDVPAWVREVTVYGEDGIAGALATLSLIWGSQAAAALVTATASPLLSSPAPSFRLPYPGRSCTRRQLVVVNQAAAARTFLFAYR
jgi:hypothetical protein